MIDVGYENCNQRDGRADDIDESRDFWSI
jgi:hypothetical protein